MGDIAPSDGVSKEEKHRMETNAVNNIVEEMLHKTPEALALRDLWKVM